MEAKTYVSGRGIALVLKAVSQFKLDTLRTTKSEVQPPTYEVEVVGGEKQTYALDEKIAENKGRLDEWQAFVKAKKEQDAAYSKKFTELIIWDGIGVEVPGPDSEWQKNCDYFGIKIPENPIERKLFYVYNEVLVSPGDIGELIAEVFTVSQVNEEAVQNLRDNFRAGIQRETNRALSKKSKPVEGKVGDV